MKIEKTKLFYNTALLLPQAGVFHLPAYVRRRAGGKHQHEANDTFLKNYSIQFVFTQSLKLDNCQTLIKVSDSLYRPKISLHILFKS